MAANFVWPLIWRIVLTGFTVVTIQVRPFVYIFILYLTNVCSLSLFHL